MVGSRRGRRRTRARWLGALTAAVALATPASAFGQAGDREFRVSARPDGSGLPGFTEAGALVNGILAFAALGTLAAFIVGGVLMAFGGLTSNYRASGHGKSALLAAVIGALFVGAAVPIINFFLDAGPS